MTQQHDEILNYFAKYIEKELGIIYAQHNFFQLHNRLEDIRKLLGIETLEGLYEIGRKEIAGNFRQMLLDIATNNETSFFRDVKVFRALEEIVFSTKFDTIRKDREIRIWSSACSSGQEPLSLAIGLTEASVKFGIPIQFQIIATDISNRILQKAQAGVYSQLEVQRGLPTPLLIKYFSKETDSVWRVSAKISNSIVYRAQNLREAFNFAEKFDIILCRNVLIYQNVEGKRDILNRIEKFMSPDCLFLLGSGESLIGLTDSFESMNIEGALIYRRKGSLIAAA